MKKDKLVIIGDRAFAEIAFEYFSHDSDLEPVAFSVERAFLQKDELFGLPVIPFEELETLYPPGKHKAFVALTYAKLNRVRTRLCEEAREKGYELASYVSSRAFVWENVTIGDNCFVFENNVIQPFVRIGNNVILWSGNHIGHHSVIGDNCFISSHVVVSGYCTIGENCFLGVNSTIGNDLNIARDCVIGAGALILRDTREGMVYKGPKASEGEAGSLALFGVEDE